jgi:predicted DNA-binding transcriptional regulator AlpA
MTAPIHHVPAFPSKSRLAAELDMAESTVDEMVKRGVLPPPIRLSTGCVRWRWADIESALASLNNGRATEKADPYAAGADNVTKIAEGCRDTA